MASDSPQYHTPWVWSHNSNVHVANRKELFTSLTPFPTSLRLRHQSSEPTNLHVVGIGDIELPTFLPREPGTDGENNANIQTTITLRNVCYVPNAPCNVIGSPVLDRYTMTLGNHGMTLASKASGKKMAMLALGQHDRHYKLWLREQSWTEITRKSDDQDHFRVKLPSRKKKDFEALKKKLKTCQEERERLKPEEKQFLERHLGGEAHFLETSGFDIKNREERRKGRQLVRMKIEEITEDLLTCPTGPHDVDPTDVGVNRSLSSVNQHYTKLELLWVKKNCGDLRFFLKSHALDCRKYDDCRKGKAILSKLMADSSNYEDIRKNMGEALSTGNDSREREGNDNDTASTRPMAKRPALETVNQGEIGEGPSSQRRKKRRTVHSGRASSAELAEFMALMTSAQSLETPTSTFDALSPASETSSLTSPGSSQASESQRVIESERRRYDASRGRDCTEADFSVLSPT